MVAEVSQKKVMVTLPVLLVGGTEIQTLAVVKALLIAEYRVEVCCYYEYEDAVVDQLRGEGAEVLLLGLGRSGQGPVVAALWTLLRRLLAVFREARPDIVHIQYMAPGLVPIVAARLAGIRTIFATVHQPGSPYGRKAKLLLRTAASLCTAFFCISRAVEESWFGNSAAFDPAKAHTRRHWTINNAVDVEKIAAIAATTDVPAIQSEFGFGAGPVIGCVGRLRHEKGQALLLDAMAEVVKAFPMARLLVVGDGPDADTLKHHAAQKGLQNHVIWCGKTVAERVFQLYRLMDVVAVPSLFEGFGLVAAEAMAAGRAVVASAVDGLAEVVEDGVTGLLVPPGDSSALAAALIDLLQHPAQAIEMGRQGEERVQKLFSMERYRESILAAYARCVNPGHAGDQG